jgi:putative ABC transport system substrate-binding protein
VSSGDPSTEPRLAALWGGLGDLGYVEGKNLRIEYRYVEDTLDRVPALVTELVQLKVDMLVIGFLPAIHAAKKFSSQVSTAMPAVDSYSQRVNPDCVLSTPVAVVMPRSR